jgi:hypothetical protein
MACSEHSISTMCTQELTLLKYRYVCTTTPKDPRKCDEILLNSNFVYFFFVHSLQVMTTNSTCTLFLMLMTMVPKYSGRIK